MPPRKSAAGATGAPRAEAIADAALDLLAERGMRGLTHRAVDEAAGLPQGSTSNYARTRLALLEAAVRRLAVRESRVLAVDELPDPAGGIHSVVDGMALALHRYLTKHPQLLVCRYELALEATRRPELRTFFDETGGSSTNPSPRCCGPRGPGIRAAHAVAGGLVRGNHVLVRGRGVPRVGPGPGGTAGGVRGTVARDARRVPVLTCASPVRGIIRRRARHESPYPTELRGCIDRRRQQRFCSRWRPRPPRCPVA